MITHRISALASALDSWRTVQETGRNPDLTRAFSGSYAEISAQVDSVRDAHCEVLDSIKFIGELMSLVHPEAVEGPIVPNIGRTLFMLSELVEILADESFALSERQRPGRDHEQA